MKLESDGDTNCNWCARNSRQMMVKGLEDLDIGGQVETIQNTALSKSARIQSRDLET